MQCCAVLLFCPLVDECAGARPLAPRSLGKQVEMEKKMLLERKRREDAERRQQQEEMERILEENKRKVGAAQGAGWGTAGMAGGLL